MPTIFQVSQVGKEFYNTEIKIVELHVDEAYGTSYFQMKLLFDNPTVLDTDQVVISASDELDLPITSTQFFNLFPFHMVMNRSAAIAQIE